jgi:large subunit ribosomal protein L24
MIKKGDMVQVISGQHKGEKGRVLQVIPASRRVIIENINVIKKALRPTQKNPKGGFEEREASIHVSNVQLIDSQTSKPTRVYTRLEGNRKVRFAKSGTRLDE